MNSASKTLTLTLIVLLLTSLLAIALASVDVQAVTKPSVPQFTVKLIDNSYNIPPSTTTTTNPYTGEKTTIDKPGYCAKNMTLEIAVKNQPWSPSVNDKEYKLYYKVQYKGHFADEEKWRNYGRDFGLTEHIAQSSGQYTVISGYMQSFNSFTAGSQLDFRVQAVIGHTVIHYHDYGYDNLFAPPYSTEFVIDTSSDWSKIQTITIPDLPPITSPSQTSPHLQNPTTTPDNNNNQPQQPDPSQPSGFMLQPTVLLWLGTILFTGIAIWIIMMLRKRHLKNSTDIGNSYSQTFA